MAHLPFTSMLERSSRAGMTGRVGTELRLKVKRDFWTIYAASDVLGVRCRGHRATCTRTDNVHVTDAPLGTAVLFLGRPTFKSNPPPPLL